jgi:uncharacterized membrane protein YbhN (UPF0104 family)
MNSSNQNTPRQWLWIAVKIAASCSLLLWLSTKISYADAARHLFQADVPKVLLAFSILGISLALTALRWYFASTRLIPLTIALRYTWISQFYGLFLPGATSADIAKGVAMTANGDSPDATALVVSILLERFAGLSSVVIVGLLAHSLQPFLFPVSRTLTAAAAIIGFVLLACFPVLARLVLRPLPKTTRLVRAREVARRLDGKMWGISLFLSFAIVATNVTFYWTVYLAAGGEAQWIQMATYTCLDGLAALLPVSVAGIGIRDSLAVALFARSGEGTREVAFAWTVLLLMAGHGLIGFLLQCRQSRPTQSRDYHKPQLPDPGPTNSNHERHIKTLVTEK